MGEGERAYYAVGGMKYIPDLPRMPRDDEGLFDDNAASAVRNPHDGAAAIPAPLRALVEVPQKIARVAGQFFAPVGARARCVVPECENPCVRLQLIGDVVLGPALVALLMGPRACWVAVEAVNHDDAVDW